jgi:membrane-associated phospholipid phosphatase
MSWKKSLSQKVFRMEFVFSLVILIVVLFCLSDFLQYVELRNGVVLDDPILKLFKPVDVTWLTFGLIYFSIILVIITLIKDPEQLLFAIQCYIMMILIRIIMMFLLPLNPPQNMIALNDPFVQFFGTGKTLTKDLFFSGHTATLFLFFLVVEKKIIKSIFLIFTVLVGISVLLQHVHYTIDVAAAPFFSYSSYRIIKIVKHDNRFSVD